MRVIPAVLSLHVTPVILADPPLPGIRWVGRCPDRPEPEIDHWKTPGYGDSGFSGPNEKEPTLSVGSFLCNPSILLFLPLFT
jgi:hypothetical protein